MKTGVCFLVVIGAFARADEPDVASAVKALTSDHTGTRVEAIEKLRAAAPGRPGVLSQVLDLVDHESEDVRADIVRLLGRLGAVRATGIRGHSQRRKRARRLISKQSEAAVARGLDWLASVQSKDGRWDSDAHGGGPHFDTGITGYVLLAFFGSGMTDRDGRHAATVRRALDHLLSTQGKNGRFGGLEHARFGVRHSIVTSAICEAWILTWDPKYRAAARRAVAFLGNNRLAGSGWGYHDHKKADTFETAWALHALRFAEFGGIDVRMSDLRAGFGWIARVTDPDFGVVGYEHAGGYAASYGWQRGFAGDLFPAAGKRLGVFVDRDKHAAYLSSMTASAAWCCYLCLPRPDRVVVMKKHAANVAQSLPKWDAKHEYVDFSMWPTSGLVVIQRHGVHGAPTARKWFKQLHAALLPNQDDNGSWEPVGPWGPSGGRLFSTASAVLALEAPYRYSHRLVQKPEFEGPHKDVYDALRKLSRKGSDAIRALAREAIEQMNRDGSRYLTSEIYAGK